MKTETLAVASARCLDDLRLELRFSDGAVWVLDFRPSIERQQVPAYRTYLNPLEVQEIQNRSRKRGLGEDWDLVFPVWKLHEGMA